MTDRQSSQRNWIVPLSIFGVLAVFMLIVGRWPHPNKSFSATQVFSQAAGSVVRIEIDCEDGSELIGTGFVAALEQHPYILTNKHVVENANRMKVGIREDLLFDVPNYWLAKNEDLAVLEIPAELQVKALPLRRTPVQPGEIGYTIGFPIGLGKSITQGVVSTNYGAALQFDVPISSGSSGGPVLDGHAEVVGIPTMGSKASTEAIVQNLNVAISVSAFRPLASFQSPSRATMTPGSKLQSSSPELPSPVQAPSIIPTKEPIVKRAELVYPRSSPARASPTATAASHIEEGVEVRRALPLTSGTQTPESAPTPQQAPVNQTTQPALAEAERLLNQTYNDLRLSLSPKNREVLKVKQLKWRKERDNFRNNPSEYLRMTEERTRELNHMLTRGEN
jgi:Trypsin-like peptidase domain